MAAAAAKTQEMMPIEHRSDTRRIIEAFRRIYEQGWQEGEEFTPYTHKHTP
eukprot:CAMPEP_0206603792 /NCGR_PEP_ID=MMETSP0325_2-20121206/48804_1 /ASSEMBLY_ACC=CAM_ASM_000347 /TAXON_ID=2866 /ORGANISM="Crypthecodinium cohnii, Strain Seligo" /LENGTH=50 /DNA_ID=CAMNT_0054117759 /DNA_START=33 /DNA_END=181 /DNA_ORIENTATION=+